MVRSCIFRPASRFRAGPYAPTPAPLAPAGALRLRGRAPGASPSPSPFGPRGALSKPKKYRHFRGDTSGPGPPPPPHCVPKTFEKHSSAYIAKKHPATRTHLPYQQRTPIYLPASKTPPARSSPAHGRPEEAGQTHAASEQIPHPPYLSTCTRDRARRRASSRAPEENSPSRAQQHRCCAPFARAYRHSRSS